MRKKYLSSILISSALLLIAASISCGGDQLAHDVAYVIDTENQHMFVLDRAGENSKVINDSVSEPKWSPNQKTVAYLSDMDDGKGQLKVWHRDDGDTERVPDAPANVEEFFWSPDSRMIAYQANTANESQTEVFIHNFEDGETTLLVSEPAGNVELGNWSGDNQWIVMCLNIDGSPGLYKRSVHGVDEVQLTDYEDSRPRFSFDGRSVAFARKLDDGSTDIYALEVDTGDGPSAAKALTDHDGDETDFEWSPDGRNIIYVTEGSGSSEIYAVDIREKDSRRLTQNRIPDADPKWSIDGSKVLFRSNTDGKFHLFEMDFKSGAQVRILEAPDSIVSADW